MGHFQSQLVSYVDSNTSAEHHMQLDKKAIEESPHAPLMPFLRFYTWPRDGAITLGRFLKIEDLLDSTALPLSKISIAARPTGGGLLLHGSFDCAFSLLLPAMHPLVSKDPKENYKKLHSLIEEALMTVIHSNNDQVAANELLDEQVRLEPYCMASKTQYDILWSGYKVGGSACRITKKGLLFQASIFVDEPHWHEFNGLLRDGQKAIQQMKSRSLWLNALSELRGRDTPLSITELQSALESVFMREI